MTITLKVSDKTKEQMLDFFEDLKRDKTPDYAVFQAQDGDTVVTLYESGKCVFQGKDADLSSQFWVETEKLNSGKAITTNSEDKKKEEKQKIDPRLYNSTSIGSDEVGTGDYFGPIVVTAAYVRKEDIPFLESIGVKDSKKLTDEKILEIVPKVTERIKYHTVILNNKDYNEKYSQGFNMNKLKAILHNKALSTLKSENIPYDFIVVDQFAEKFVYFSYLKESTNVVRDITFVTKGEDKSLAVACASIISRYIFIKEFSKLSKDLDMLLPKGAGPSVDATGVKIVEKYGFDKLKEVSKMNFKNTDKIKELLNK